MIETKNRVKLKSLIVSCTYADYYWCDLSEKMVEI